MAIWDDIFRELRNLWEIITTGEPLEEEEPEEEIAPEEPDEGGGFFGDLFGAEEPEQPEEPPPSGSFWGEDADERTGYASADDGGYFAYTAGEGPYPDSWGEPEQRFWDRQFDGHFFDDQGQYDRGQVLFYDGYMAKDDEISHEDRVQARNDFLDETYFDAIDWDAFADYYSET
jgi:hypothetical protein